MNLPKRNDNNMPFMMKFENVAWYESGQVRILDRRIYPIRTEYVTCTHYLEVAKCIGEMVTQSEGPYTACLMGMALACYQVRNESKHKMAAFLKQAAFDLSHARPTTSAQMIRLCDDSYSVIYDAIEQGIWGNELVDIAFEFAFNYINNNYASYDKVAHYLTEKFPKSGTVMTMCFAGTVIGTMLRECCRQNMNIKFICCETRPYYQGSRLTASCCQDMGFDTTVICDNMPAYTMQHKNVDIFTSAADVITCDGHIVNKIGTFQVAMLADYYHIPYYATGTPDPSHKDISTIVIEERDSAQVTHSLEQKIVMDGVKGYYPAFDITPPKFVRGIVTDKGIYTPNNLNNYFND